MRNKNLKMVLRIVKFKNLITAICLLILQVIPSEQQFRSLILERQTLQSYCSSLRSCNDCKNGAFQCEWCHDVGCTNFPRLHCPNKLFSDKILRKDSLERYCTEVVTRSPFFVPADVKRIIKLELKIDDMTLYERNIVCEIRIENNIVQVKGALEKNVINCDATSLNIKQSIGLGSMRLIWGGVEPYSNTVLIVVYRCRHLAHNCADCLALSKEFQCGWCKESAVCSLMEECPGRYGLWVDKNLSCDKYDSKAFTQFHSQHSYWY